MLGAEAEQLCNAGRYERTDARRDSRAGSYRRKLGTQAGEVELKIPKLRQQTFEAAIIERYRRRESSVEEALIEMYLAGVSVRRVEDITEALCGARGYRRRRCRTSLRRSTPRSKRGGTGRLRATIPTYTCVYLDGIALKRTWAGEVRNVALLVAIGVNAEGYRDILGIVEGAKEDNASWLNFLKHLTDCGLNGARLIISHACLGLGEAAPLAELGERATAGPRGWLGEGGELIENLPAPTDGTPTSKERRNLDATWACVLSYVIYLI